MPKTCEPCEHARRKFFIKEEIYNLGWTFLGGNQKKLKFIFSIIWEELFWKYLGEIVLDFFGNIREEFFVENSLPRTIFQNFLPLAV